MSLYYTLITALPWLGEFEKLKELPLSTIKLEQRFGMLSDTDREQVALALALYQREPNDQASMSDSDEVKKWQALLDQLTEPAIKQVLTEYLQNRTLMSALRYRKAGLTDPNSFCGIGDMVWLIRRNWQLPMFGLEHRFRWLVTAHQQLEKMDTAALEQQQLALLWQRLEQLEQDQGFALASIIAYRLRWEIACYRLRWKAQGAIDQFEKLLTQSLHQTEQLLQQKGITRAVIETGSQA